ncbi:YaaC family protein [Magnetospirillum sp. 64-120]|uniref:YaaC family protein n=1 Tax=Magnetospirillum sp. 64-120 TaxID=1895778 RepID=UPI0025BE19B3|nr:YaaC family protein [Magnetospirillum sp. 64-120]
MSTGNSTSAKQMLDGIFDDRPSIEFIKEHSFFNKNIDVNEFNEKRKSLTEQWKHLHNKDSFDNKIENFFKANSLIEQKDDQFNGAINYSRLTNEVSKRIESEDPLQIIKINSNIATADLLNVSESLENPDEIKSIYKIRKLTSGSGKGSGLKNDEAIKLRSCLRQGRELFLSGKNGDLMAKPLNYFYSVTAYSFAVSILNNPIRYALESKPGGHGTNFLLEKMEVQFGGAQALGTFSELFTAFPTSIIKNSDTEVIQDNTESIIAFYNSKMSATTGTLLSMIPEIRQYYKIITKNKGRTHPLTISQSRASSWTFEIGDGESKASNDDIQRSFPNCNISEKNGKHYVTVAASELHKIKACLHSDSAGAFWYIENPFFPVILPNFCVHFLLTNMFSNVMRYSPDRWGTILLNEANHDCSLIVRSYLSCFEQNFLPSVLRLVSRFYPVTI